MAMGGKCLIIVSSDNRDKIGAALMFAYNAARYRWLDDVKVVFFGPSENLIAEGDSEVLRWLDALRELGVSFTACKRYAEDKGILEKVSVRSPLEYVGSVIAGLVSEGYVPMVF